MTVVDQKITDSYGLYNGDSCEVIKGIPSNSIDYSIFSPPFASLYTYSASSRDMGNCKDDEEFYEHYKFLVEELYRIIKPGRLVSFHVMNLPTLKSRDGFIGLKDFRGDNIKLFQDAGWIYHSEVCIWKDPVTAMQRSKALGLLHKQIMKDSAMSRQGLPDYVVTMRKPGTNPDPVDGCFNSYTGEPEDEPKDEYAGDFERLNRYSINVWQRYASPVWMDIRQNRTLTKESARNDDDERHICLARGSLVLTKERGYVPIEELNIGEHAFTHKGRWKPIIAKKKTADNAKVVKINATGVCNLILTPTHKVWAKKLKTKNFSKRLSYNVEPEWIESKDLEKSYLNLQVPENENETYLSKEDWWIVGRWIADGHIDQRNSAIISCGEDKLEVLKEKLGDRVGNPRWTGTAYQIPIKDVGGKLREVLIQCGLGAINKQIPSIGLTLNKELSESLLKGYLSGDGHYNKDRDRWSACSISKKLLLGVQILVHRVYGVTSTLQFQKAKENHTIQGREVNCQDSYALSFQTGGYRFSYVDSNNNAWKRVKSVDDFGESETWNIHVEEDNSYVSEGCVVKNCPLQLDVVERCVELWSNPGDVVFSPFMGIGTEGYVSLRCGRKFIGVELKKDYYSEAVSNIENSGKHEDDIKVIKRAQMKEERERRKNEIKLAEVLPQERVGDEYIESGWFVKVNGSNDLIENHFAKCHVFGEFIPSNYREYLEQDLNNISSYQVANKVSFGAKDHDSQYDYGLQFLAVLFYKFIADIETNKHAIQSAKKLGLPEVFLSDERISKIAKEYYNNKEELLGISTELRGSFKK